MRFVKASLILFSIPLAALVGYGLWSLTHREATEWNGLFEAGDMPSLEARSVYVDSATGVAVPFRYPRFKPWRAHP